jgi:type II secretory pathway pseudopilin PulG
MNMQERQATGLFLEIFVVMAILGILSAIAIPHVGQMINKSKVESREVELHNIHTAVTEMLYDSTTRTLEPVGPTVDMSQVHTRDTPPLVLSDYLLGLNGNSLKLSCSYIFNADGTVTQVLP